ncbi:hypothetical protein RO3G_04161 [Rhizopus delemar RA 99-880]|uniref:Uncharacterized protein n=1 Tax=Rhizopus delemar (strain RA 99-880 / ATCC MYA-4621 / FGSC 9543 / NRRL 43880) TaxID=246409 RepID=I1BTC6_RHIO9|nr:hypothetical protein RO3G_04161 [Rhizopus delemar RA 99-880]|eukprot:EIE79456.1 hypothetical protein RO3G_04161 [Rhizopus delemar RA 99-880]
MSGIFQVVYAGPMFANYFYRNQLKNKQVPIIITHNLVYQLFPLLTGQGKKADEADKAIQSFGTDSLTVAQRKSLGHHVYQKKLKPSISKWPSSAENSEANKNIVKNALLHWKEYDTSNSKEPKEANVYASLHHYLKWFHAIQEKMNKAIHRNIKSTEGVSKLNAKDYKSLKKAVLVYISSNNPLGDSKKFKKLYADDLEKVKSFIKDTRKEI